MFEAILSLLGGLSLFLFGMSTMGSGLEKAAGNQLKTILGKMTANPVSGFFLGLIVTAVIQSSSATTVMLVGFVNAGLITLRGAIPVIMGANIGTTVTAWILSLESIGDGANWLMIFKPSTFTPFLAVAGVVLFVFLKNERARDIGTVFLGFAAVIFGMDMMSSGFKIPEVESALGEFFTTFASNPLLGLLTGIVVTAIIQSSSASVGILQTVALATPGAFTVGTALNIIMGQKIGTCVTAVLGSAGANKDAKRVAAVHLSFNVIGAAFILSVFSLFNYLILPDGFAFAKIAATPVTISVLHTITSVISTAILLPCNRLLEKLATLLVRDNKGEEEKHHIFDDRLLATPSIAIEHARKVTVDMAELAFKSIDDAFRLFENYDKKLFNKINEDEGRVDVYEDEIGSYLVKITGCDLSEQDSLEVSKLLHMIGDIERISDHAVNLADSAEEMHRKSLSFSDKAKEELTVIISAVREIIRKSAECFENNDLQVAASIEPLEEVIDRLQSQIKTNHINRLKNNECTIELGFILNDLLTNLERISDHCSNIGGCVIEIAHSSLGIHGYTRALQSGNEAYQNYFKMYSETYKIKD